MRSSRRSRLRALRLVAAKPLGTQVLVIEAAAWLCGARLLIDYLPFCYWRDRLGTTSAANVEDPATPSWSERERERAREIGRIVARTAEYLPFRAVCLPQAMAACWMLRRRGLSSTLVIGAMLGQSSDDLSHLHAWLQAGGACITGAREMQAYTPVVRFTSHARARTTPRGV